MKLTTSGSLPTAAGNIIPSTLQSPAAVRFISTMLLRSVLTGDTLWSGIMYSWVRQHTTVEFSAESAVWTDHFGIPYAELCRPRRQGTGRGYRT
jgi:hypothetical protein